MSILIATILFFDVHHLIDFSASFDNTVMIHTIDLDHKIITTEATIQLPHEVASAALIFNGDACIVGVQNHLCFVIGIESAQIIGQTQQRVLGYVLSISSGGMRLHMRWIFTLKMHSFD